MRAPPIVWAQNADERESTQNSTSMPALAAGTTMAHTMARVWNKMRTGITFMAS